MDARHSEQGVCLFFLPIHFIVLMFCHFHLELTRKPNAALLADGEVYERD